MRPGKKKKKKLEIAQGCAIVTEDETKKWDVGTVVLHHHPRMIHSGSYS